MALKRFAILLIVLVGAFSISINALAKDSNTFVDAIDAEYAALEATAEKPDVSSRTVKVTETGMTEEEIIANGETVKADAEAALMRARYFLSKLEGEEAKCVVVEESELTESTEPEDDDETEETLPELTWKGDILTKRKGTVQGPNGKETWYNLDMTGVVNIMHKLGYDYEYWVREDGVKMFGPYIMCACNLEERPRGSVIQTSLGWAMVCDTGTYGQYDRTWTDIAVTW